MSQSRETESSFGMVKIIIPEQSLWTPALREVPGLAIDVVIMYKNRIMH
jgi:hypothetical protein